MSRVALALFAKHKFVVFLSISKEVGKGAIVQSLPHKKLHGRELLRGTLGISIKFTLRPGFSLPYVPPIDDGIDTLGALIGTVVAWPIHDLVKDPTITGTSYQASKNPKGKSEGLWTWHKPIVSTGVSMALRSNDVEKIQTQKERIEHKTLSKKQLINSASQVIESKQKTRATNDDDPTWEIPVTKKKRSAMTNTQKKNKPHVNKVKDNEEASGKATTIEKKKLLEEVEVSKIASGSLKNFASTSDDASDEEGEEEGVVDKDCGLFTRIEKSTLKWDLLDESMQCLEVKYMKALQSIVSRREEFIAEEFAAEYCNAFYTANKKGQKNTQRVAAIVDSSLGEEWWNLIMGLDWSKKPKWLTDDRLYTLACAELPNDHLSNVLTTVISNDPSSIYPTIKHSLKEWVVFQEAETQQITRQQQQGLNLRSLKRKEKEVQEHLEVEDEEDNKEWRTLNSDRETTVEFKVDKDDDADISDNPPPSPTRSVTKDLEPTQTEVVDLTGTLEYLKRLEREKHTAEQRAAQLAWEKKKEALSRKAEEPILEPTQGSPKRPRQEEEEEDIEDIQADPIPPSPISIPPTPSSSPITPFPPASTPQTPPSPLPLETPLSPPAPISPQ
ncbi:hypothetical protein L7F22_037039 [Adiantum nelumboides]|nr:hypothetical protein [Adiantum nelumboides]